MRKHLLAALGLVPCIVFAEPIIYECNWENGGAKGVETFKIDLDAKTVNGKKAIQLAPTFADFETEKAHFWIDIDVGSYTVVSRDGTLIEASAGACRPRPKFRVLYRQIYREAGNERPHTDRSRY
ncbi:hypothetical protein [Herbaspirillum robiniae]|uniref:hypothetical protein n=1 Tax=Herbaspirillum robiniae TaxID=2014887 RepID=UPI0011E4D188|nr:hypothetical protein [Herbaspirillum robiniae]